MALRRFTEEVDLIIDNKKIGIPHEPMLLRRTRPSKTCTLSFAHRLKGCAKIFQGEGTGGKDVAIN